MTPVSNNQTDDKKSESTQSNESTTVQVVRGKIKIDIPPMLPSPSILTRSTPTIIGVIRIVVGSIEITVDLHDVIIEAGSMFIPFNAETSAYGTISILYYVNVNIGGQPLENAGITVINVPQEADYNINDPDNDGSEEYDLFNDVGVNPSYSASGLPIIRDLISSGSSVSVPYVNISGIIENYDINSLSIRINNRYMSLSLLDIDSDGIVDLDQFIDLLPGRNIIQVICTNTIGTVYSDRIYVDYSSAVSGDEMILFTLNWDTDYTDLDLHVFYYSESDVNSGSQPLWQCAYWNRQITDNWLEGLDRDDTDGYGPEHFTMLGLQNGYYIITVNSYRIDNTPTNAFMTIKAGDKQGTYGPYRFSNSNGESYPVSGDSWWRVCDIRIVNGMAEIIDADTSITILNPAANELRSSRSMLFKNK